MKTKIFKPRNLKESPLEAKVRDEVINSVGRDVEFVGIKNHCRVEVNITMIRIIPIYKC
jgi:hypothetical protein